jgi:hypothetical protein
MECQGEIENKDMDDHLANRAGPPADIVLVVEYFINAVFVTGQEVCWIKYRACTRANKPYS